MTSVHQTLKELILEDIPAHSIYPMNDTIRLGQLTAVTHLEVHIRDILGHDPAEVTYLAEDTSKNPQTIFPPNLETLKFFCRSYNSHSPQAWDRLVDILKDESCLQKLNKIVVKPRRPYKFPENLIAACKARGIELSEDPAYLRPLFVDNFHGEGGQYP